MQPRFGNRVTHVVFVPRKVSLLRNGVPIFVLIEGDGEWENYFYAQNRTIPCFQRFSRKVRCVPCFGACFLECFDCGKSRKRHSSWLFCSSTQCRILYMLSCIHTKFPKNRVDMPGRWELCSPWSDVLGLVLCLRWRSSGSTAYKMRYKWLHSTRAHMVLWSAVYHSAPRTFPSEYGLLSQTPGIASGTLLACRMWTEQRGNKEYGNLQIITELKTSCPLSPPHKVLCSISKHL